MSYEPHNPLPLSPRELIVVARPEAQLRVTDRGVVSRTNFDVRGLNELLRQPGRSLHPLFRPGKKAAALSADHQTTKHSDDDQPTQHSADHQRVERRDDDQTTKRKDDYGRRTKDAVAPPDLSVFFRLSAPDRELDSLARQLHGQPAIAMAYVKPGAVPPVWHTGSAQKVLVNPGRPRTPRRAHSSYRPLFDFWCKVRSISRLFCDFLRQAWHICTVKPAEQLVEDSTESAPEEVPASTPGEGISSLFGNVSEITQGYLDDPPRGLGARSVWEQYRGADGTGVKIIDIEGAWRFTHTDLQVNQGGPEGGLVGGTQNNDPDWAKHGTAVLGVLGGDKNNFGITGICPGAVVQAVSNINASRLGWGTATAIQEAADLLDAGDIILIELQMAGPPSFIKNAAQNGYIPVEWWEDNLAAIRYATLKDVIVVEAGGNGQSDLNSPTYDDSQGLFSSSWSNPFKRNSSDSGAIIVGAGAPPEGTHFITEERDRSRLPFSNHGAMFDAQGWGMHVETCGGGGRIFLGAAEDEDVQYTRAFNGTSSAAAMVAGALGCIQGALKGKGLPPLTPAEARELLRREGLGSPQQEADDSPDRPRSFLIGSRPDLIKMIPAAIAQQSGLG